MQQARPPCDAMPLAQQLKATCAVEPGICRGARSCIQYCTTHGAHSGKGLRCARIHKMHTPVPGSSRLCRHMHACSTRPQLYLVILVQRCSVCRLARNLRQHTGPPPHYHRRHQLPPPPDAHGQRSVRTRARARPPPRRPASPAPTPHPTFRQLQPMMLGAQQQRDGIFLAIMAQLARRCAATCRRRPAG
jgi:hypothetical protein